MTLQIESDTNETLNPKVLCEVFPSGSRIKAVPVNTMHLCSGEREGCDKQFWYFKKSIYFHEYKCYSFTNECTHIVHYTHIRKL